MPSDPTFRIICPNLKCRATLTVSESARGKVVRCRQCQSRVAVPARSQSQAESAPPATPAAPGTPTTPATPAT